MGSAPRSGRSKAKAYKRRRKDGNYLMEQHLKEMLKPRPVTVTIVDPEIIRQRIKETAKK